MGAYTGCMLFKWIIRKTKKNRRSTKCASLSLRAILFAKNIRVRISHGTEQIQWYEYAHGIEKYGWMKSGPGMPDSTVKKRPNQMRTLTKDVTPNVCQHALPAPTTAALRGSVFMSSVLAKVWSLVDENLTRNFRNAVTRGDREGRFRSLYLRIHVSQWACKDRKCDCGSNPINMPIRAGNSPDAHTREARRFNEVVTQPCLVVASSIIRAATIAVIRYFFKSASWGVPQPDIHVPPWSLDEITPPNGFPLLLSWRGK